MTTSTETTPAEKTSPKKMVILLLLAFLGAQLSNAGTWAALFAQASLTPGRGGGAINVSLFSYNPAVGILATPVAFLFFLAGFLALSSYPQRGWRQVAAAFLAVIPAGIATIANFNSERFALYRYNISPDQLLATGIGIAVAVCLLAGGRIKSWPDLVGLGLGLLIGIGLWIWLDYRNIVNLYAFSSIWLSAVFFSEAFSRRAGWGAVLIGALIWVCLIALSNLSGHGFF